MGVETPDYDDTTHMKNLETSTRRTVLKSIGTGIAGGLALSGSAAARGNGGLKRELADVRAATAKYHDPENAIADGYIPEREAVCGMGYHYPHEDLVEGIKTFQRDRDLSVLKEYLGSIDRTEPPVLTYGEDDEGNLVLGAVEYLTFDKSDDLFEATDDDQWEPFIPPIGVYALHAWVHFPNPKGVFHSTNPRPQFTHHEWCHNEDGHH